MRDKVSLLLVTSNGVGMGHLARQLAIGLAGGRAAILSMSAATPNVSALNVPSEYCPGPDRDWIPPNLWPHYVAARIGALAEEVEADAVVFDGVAPYRGVTLARRHLRDTPFVWFRRGMWRPGANEGQLWKSDLFDLVIEPGDLASPADRGATSRRSDAVHVPPVSLGEVVPALDRAQARLALGLSPDLPALLLTLGSGRLGDVSPGSMILDAVLDLTDWQVGLITSAIANREIPASESDRVVPVRGVFPLVKYLAAFDAAVSAAGYNSVHELIPAGLPTLLIPNVATRTDDQVARAEYLAKAGLALTPPDLCREGVNDAVSNLTSAATRSQVEGAIAAVPDERKSGGARETARVLGDFVASFTPSRPNIATRLANLRDDSKESLKRVLGPNGTNAVRRLLGRPEGPSGEKLRVVVDPRTPTAPSVRRLSFREETSVEQLTGNDPVEHLVAGASSRYLSQRELIVSRFYEVISRP